MQLHNINYYFLDHELGSRVPQRYAIDWVKFGPEGRLVKDDSSKNENWYRYGVPIHSVAAGLVIRAVDGIPENVPLTKERAVPMSIDTLCGNYVVVDIGGMHALYAHMVTGSVKVKVGDIVKTGQVLGLMGNSGNSDAPHLHFHINRAPSTFPLAAEGLLFVHPLLQQTGTLKIPFGEAVKKFDDLTWDNADVTTTDRKGEMALGYRSVHHYSLMVPSPPHAPESEPT